MSLVAQFEALAGNMAIVFDLKIAAGEVVALLGPNGAGKSSTLRCLAGIAPIQQGAIQLNGEPWADAAAGIDLAPEQRRMAVVFQDDRLFTHLTAVENVAFGPRSLGASSRSALSTAHHWLDRLGVDHLTARNAGRLSGGEARRVTIARALASEPRALALDEPTTGLDVQTRHAVRAELRRQLETINVPTLVVTHDQMDAAILADRIVVMEEGRLTQTGDLAEITARPRTDWIAKLAGTNLWAGTATGSTVMVGEVALTIAEPHTGDVLVSVPPRAVTLSPARPSGSARNVTSGRISSLDPIGDRIRVTIDGPLIIVAEVTTAAVSSLHLASDATFFASVKATELEVYPR